MGTIGLQKRKLDNLSVEFRILIKIVIFKKNTSHMYPFCSALRWWIPIDNLLVSSYQLKWYKNGVGNKVSPYGLHFSRCWQPYEVPLILGVEVPQLRQSSIFQALAESYRCLSHLARPFRRRNRPCVVATECWLLLGPEAMVGSTRQMSLPASRRQLSVTRILQMKDMCFGQGSITFQQLSRRQKILFRRHTVFATSR